MSPTDQRDRRRTPRVDLLSEFQGHVVRLDEVVTVQQLGSGGMTIAARVPLSPAHTHDLRLTFDDRVLTLRAKVVHTRALLERDDVTYVSGLAFVDPPEETVAVIEQFLRLHTPGDLPN